MFSPTSCGPNLTLGKFDKFFVHGSRQNTSKLGLLFKCAKAWRFLVDLLLLIDAELSRATVDQEEETSYNGQNLEEVILGEILVGVVLVKLRISVSHHDKGPTGGRNKLTVQKLFTPMLKMLRMTTRSVALNLALKPTTTMTQATRPTRETTILHTDHWPLKTNPMKRKIRSTRPASWKYILRSFSSSWGRPAKALVFRTQESDRTIRRPPQTERFRRKKLRSKIKP